jgi:hypothetical protein
LLWFYLGYGLAVATGFAEGEQFNTVEQGGATNVAVVQSRPVAAETRGASAANMTWSPCRTR